MIGKKIDPQNIFDNLALEDYKFEKKGENTFIRVKRWERKKFF
jgi:hypothetical protein